jgi:putative methyltransferase (TIGR04325 family)
MTVRGVLRAIAPPIVLQALRRRQPEGLQLVGSPQTWAEARAASAGYNHPEILERVLTATRDVVAGRAAFERDSVLFDSTEVPLAVVAGVLRSAALDDGRAHVIDIGGSLGSTYRQGRHFLAALSSLRWDIVEQAAFVAAGRAEFETAELHFLETLAEVMVGPTRVTVLLSACLQYLETPFDLLMSLSSLPSRHLILDRTPVCESESDHLYVQMPPPSVYEATYPTWVFSHARLIERLAPDWVLVADQPGMDGDVTAADGLRCEYRSMVFERRS